MNNRTGDDLKILLRNQESQTTDKDVSQLRSMVALMWNEK